MSDQSDMSDQMLVWPDIMSDHFKKLYLSDTSVTHRFVHTGS